MTGEEILKFIGYVVVAMFIVHYFINCIYVQTSVIEGLTMGSLDDITSSANDASSSATGSYNDASSKANSGMTPPASGEAGAAANYAAAIKANVVQLQDVLLISKYRKEYESAIINMDDYVSMLMIKLTLNMKVNDLNSDANIKILNNLNILREAKDSLNATMKYLDSQ